MKKISSKKLTLNRSTVRVLDDALLDAVDGAGGHASPTTTVLHHHSIAANAVNGCRRASASFETVMCVRPPAAAAR